jgi:hypothetical protein
LSGCDRKGRARHVAILRPDAKIPEGKQACYDPTATVNQHSHKARYFLPLESHTFAVVAQFRSAQRRRNTWRGAS